MTELTITTYEEQDYSDWRDMALKLFNDYPAEEIERGLKSILKKSSQQTFMAKDDGISVGFISTSLRVDYVEGSTTSPVGYIDMIYVKNAHRKHGLARQLFEQAEAWARRKGCTEMGSDTWLWNTDAQQFHEKIGFRKEDVLVHYIKTIKE
ncbi:aminoglycoside 6'-N-acetyltransferase [Flagellimonas algicola]|uniref:Aminoglycoside N(6')-acetyltransferase type 1 n=1 Tax=Flagellimonas algicola TaxID=2583815 RepID=A0ABY2WN53_9FLAO|nr:aminoglycoside 6'-N-acetyltransferase [Allomuricauda algicola]TMU56432.1 GNAT family N-acetyltransferase [Allomuricauda algicola]